MKNQTIEFKLLENDEESHLIQKSLNIDLNTTLKKVFELNKEDIAKCSQYFQKCETIEWPSDLSPEDISLSEKFKFNINKCVEDDNFTLFKFIRSEGHFLVDFINEKLNIESVGSVMFCQSYFAHLHDDKEAVEDSGQLMIVIENNGNNIIYSVDEFGNEKTMTPKSGDVIFLNVWEKHAILPSQGTSIKKIKYNPIKLICFN